jgi:splicing factor 3B subunit 1
VYWKVYNNLYIGAQDGVLPALPRIEDEGKNHYRRLELEVFV